MLPTLLRGRAAADSLMLSEAIEAIASQSPFRIMAVPGGRTMSVAMTNCGELGWVSDRRGYRYAALDPLTGQPWPKLPAPIRALGEAAAREAGFESFAPDVCLINRTEPGARLSLHQDRDERDFAHPIVSVSLGLPASFLFGGLDRQDRITRIPLLAGDIAVWGGPARLAFHGVAPLPDGEDPLFGRCRYTLTLRRAQ
jgi:alkylated DNA repair protein (DNA oxidative demethylase)